MPRWHLGNTLNKMLNPLLSPEGSGCGTGRSGWVFPAEPAARSLLAGAEQSPVEVPCCTKQSGHEQMWCTGETSLGSHVPTSPSRARGALTAYGDEPWTCSREYWRLYFGMECAELLSFNIRGLQKNPKHHRGHRAASPSLRHHPAPAHPQPHNVHSLQGQGTLRGCGPRRGHLWAGGPGTRSQPPRAAPRLALQACGAEMQSLMPRRAPVKPSVPSSAGLRCPTHGFLALSCGTSTATALFCTRALRRAAPRTG